MYQLLRKIINGDALGHANDDKFVIASSRSVAISDVATAQMIYERAAARVGAALARMEDMDILR